MSRPASDTPRCYPVVEVCVRAVQFNEALEFVAESRSVGRRLAVHFCSANGVVHASKDPAVRRALNAGFVVPDGMPLVWLGRLLGYDVERVCGPDFMIAFLRQARGTPLRHFFYGGESGVAERLARIVQRDHPHVQIAGSMTPGFGIPSDAELQNDVRIINESGCDILWVGLSTPSQDLWVARARPALTASAVLAVGAAFDFLTARRPRAPLLMQRYGLEWLFRLAAEPRRLWRRYTVTNAEFVGLLVRQLVNAIATRR